MNDEYSKKVCNYLVSTNIVDEKTADELYDEAVKSGLDVFGNLIKRKIDNEENITKIKAKFLNVNYMNLKEDPIDNEVLKEISEKAALFYRFIPFEKQGNLIKIGMVDPVNVEALDALKFISVKRNLKTNIFVISKSSFNAAVKQYREFGEELKNVLKNVDQVIDKKDDGKKDKKNIDKISEEAPVTKIVDIIITHAIEGKASDIHIEPNENSLVVRYRLDGILHNSLILPKKISSAVISRIKILASLKIDETRKPQDGRFRFSSSGSSERSVDLRISTFPTVNGEKIVMRILDTSSDINDFESLGIMKRGLSIINENIAKPFGIILVTGPTGSGKSTTLYAMLKILNKEGVNIVTLEDPVEYFMKGINQSQIKAEIGYTFSSGLRSILRQDPDIIMVGEIRDKETAELATHAALTGHLVLSTLHTNNATGVISRLIDMGIEPFILSSSLNVAVGQRLVRKLCNHCKEEIVPPPAILDLIKKELKDIPEDQKQDLNLEKGIRLFQGKGCEECKKTGTSGRIGIYEVLSMTPEIESAMSSNVTDHDIVVESKKQGMITMKQDGIMKAILGLTSIEEVLRVTEE
ncbi:MAG: type II/IV secretion system protein [Candidatus Pacebacteria bacterium]|nr:type II/IV secretion system protein [Candidatus Paceibacterota bacterium]